MSPDSEPQSAVQLEAEQEVDFGRYAQTIAARWWLLVVGAVLGALIGFLVSLSDGKIYKATAQTYLGQPLAPDSAAAVTTSPTTLGLVQAFVTSEEAIEKAASAAGLKPSKLRDHVTARAIPGTSTTRQAFPAPLLSIQVTGSSRAKTAAAANHLAQQAVDEVGTYTTTKIETLDNQLAYIDTQLGLVNARLNGRTHFAEGDRRRRQPQPRREARRAHEPQLRDHARRAAAGDARDQPLQHDARAVARQGHRGEPDHGTGGGRAHGADEPADERPRRRLHRPPARDRGGAALGSGCRVVWQLAPPDPCSTARP